MCACACLRNQALSQSQDSRAEEWEEWEVDKQRSGKGVLGRG